MNIINVEILESLKKDKKNLEDSVDSLIKEFENKYDGSEIKLILADNNYVNGKFTKTGMKSRLEVKINEQLIEIK